MPTIAQLSVLFTGDDRGFATVNRRVQTGLAGTQTAALDATAAVDLLWESVERLTGVLTTAAPAVSGLRTEIAGLSRAAASLNRNLDPARASAYTTALGGLGGIGSALAIEFEELQLQLRGVNRSFASQSIGTFGVRAGTTGTAVSALTGQVTALEAQVLALNVALAQTRALRPTSGSLALPGSGGASQSAAGSAGLMVGRTLTRDVTLPLLAAGAAAVVVETQFQAAMAKIEALSGISKKQTQEWGQEILALGPKVGKMPIELAQGMFYVANEIKDGRQAMDVLTKAAGMSAIGMGKTADTAKALVYILHDYAGSGLTAARATDILVAAARIGNFDVEKLVGNLGKLLPIASHMRIPFEQVAGAIAAMTKEGASVAQASTGIARLFASIEHPSVGVAKALGAVHLNAAELRHEFQVDLLGALIHVREATKGNDEAFSKIFPNIMSFKAVLATLGANLKDSRADFDQVAKSSGAFGKALATTAEADLFKYRQALASLEAAGISLGASLAPIVREVAGSVKYLADEFSHLTPNSQRAIVGVAGLLALMGPLATGIGLASKATVFLRSNLAGFSTAGAVAQFGLMAIAITEVLNLMRMLNDITDANNEQAAASDRLSKMSMKGDLYDDFKKRERQKERDAAWKAPDAWKYKKLDVYGHLQFEGYPQASAAEMHKRFLAKYSPQLALENPKITPHGTIPDGGFGETDNDAGKQKKSAEQKASERLTESLKNQLDSVSQKIRLHGNESEAAKTKDELFFGDLAGHTGQVKGLYLALDQLTKTQKDAAAKAITGHPFATLTGDDRLRSEILALQLLDAQRKKTADNNKKYAEDSKSLLADAHKKAIEILVAQAVDDRDVVALEKYGVAFAKIADPARRREIEAIAKGVKDLKAAQYDGSGVVFDNGSEAAKKAADDEKRRLDSVDPATVAFDDGSEAAAKQRKKYLDSFATSMRSLVKELAGLTKQTDEARLSEIQFDETGQKMMKHQAEQVLEMQKYVEKLRAFKAEMDAIASKGASILTGGVEHLLAHGTKGLVGSMAVDLKKQIQGTLLDSFQKQAQGWISTLLNKGAPKKPADLATVMTQNVSAVVSNTQAIIELIKTLGGDASGLSPGGGANGQTGSILSLAAGAAGQVKGGSLISGALNLASMIPKFADGGSFAGGYPIMVGERGPEIIMPSSGGQVIPNRAIGGTHNETHLNVNYQVNDGRDFNSASALQHSRQIHRHLQAAHGVT